MELETKFLMGRITSLTDIETKVKTEVKTEDQRGPLTVPLTEFQGGANLKHL